MEMVFKGIFIAIGLSLISIECSFASSADLCKNLFLSSSAKATLTHSQAKPLNPANSREIPTGHLLNEKEILNSGLLESNERNQKFFRNKKKYDQYEKELNQQRVALLDHINWVEQALKDKYIGWDDRITKIMANIRNFLVHPESNENIIGPLVIPLMTFPGYGKTSVVNDLVYFLAQHPQLAYLKNSYDYVSIGQGTTYLDLKPLADSGVSEINPKHPITRIIFWDEIQNLVPLVTLERENDQRANDEKEPKELAAYNQSMGLPKGTSIEFHLRQRQWMNQTIWNIYGNGLTSKVRSKKPSDILAKIHEDLKSADFENRSAGYFKLVREIQELEFQKAKLEQEFEEATRSMDEAIPGSRENLNQKSEALKACNSNLGTKVASHNNYLAQAVTNSYNPEGFAYFFRQKILPLLSEYRNASTILGYGKESEMLKAFVNDPMEVIRNLDENIGLLDTQELNDYRRMIVFIAGNPTPAINDILTRAQLDTRTMDVDALSRLVLGTNRKITINFFESIFGNSEAMKSRLKVNDWHIMNTYTSSKWDYFIKRRLAMSRNRFLETLDQILAPSNKAMDIEIKFDSSIKELLIERALDALGGPRVFMTNASGILNIVETNLPVLLRTLDPEHRLWKSNRVEIVRKIDPKLSANFEIPKQDDPSFLYDKVTMNGEIYLVKKWIQMELLVSYDSVANAIHVDEIEPENIKGRFIPIGRNSDQNLAILEHDWIRARGLYHGQFELGERADTKNKKAHLDQKKTLSSEKVRNAWHQAARAVIGMGSFKSVPKEISESPSTADQTLPEMWETAPVRERLNYWYAEARSLMAGYVIDRINSDLATLKLSDISKTELILLGTTVIDNIVVELNTRSDFAEFIKKSISSNATDLNDILPKDLADTKIFENVFLVAQSDSTKSFSTKLKIDALKNPLKAQVLRQLYFEVENELKNQKKVVEAVSNHLQTLGPMIDSEEIKNVVFNYYKKDSAFVGWFNRKGSRQTFQQLLSNTAGSTLEFKLPKGSFTYSDRNLSLFQKVVKFLGLD